MVLDRSLHKGKPKWLKTPIPSGKVFFEVKDNLRSRDLVTVCEEAKCPNIGECWNTNTATFMVLGETCTRACRFCNVKTSSVGQTGISEEPQHVAESCKVMGLRYVVITMVDRDDLPDGGATHVSSVIDEVKRVNNGIKVEVLAGDFQGRVDAIDVILKSRPEVYAHNIETVQGLSPRVRDARASYQQSLQVLESIKKRSNYKVFTKSALMLGLGEEFSDVVEAMRDLRQAEVDFLTIGQYMRPSKRHLAVKEWIEPATFLALEQEAKRLGFLGVASSPLVRSSYKAREFYEQAMAEQR